MDRTAPHIKGRNAHGYWRVVWTERQADGTHRSRSVSTRQKDYATAQAVMDGIISEMGRQDALAGSSINVAATVGTVIDAYLVAIRARGKTRSQEFALRWPRRLLGSYAPSDLTRSPVFLEEYRAERERHVKGPTVRRELAGIKAAFRWAENMRHLPAGSVPYVDMPAPSTPRCAWLDEAQEAQLLEDAMAWPSTRGGGLSRVARFVAIGLDTGARASAILELTWDRVDFNQRVIDFRDPGRPVSNKRRVPVPINSRLLPVLRQAYQERKGSLVCGEGSIRTTWAHFIQSYGWKDVTPHVMRHTYATLLLRAHTPPWKVATLLGDTMDQLIKTYGHAIVDQSLHDAANQRFVNANQGGQL